jgi:predicted phosphoribosyltransferase
MTPLFADRRDAGRQLGRRVAEEVPGPGTIVLGLPRGGVPVAYEVAAALEAPLDVLVVRKLGVPGHEELAMGAIASGGVRVLNHAIIGSLGLDEEAVREATAREQAELARRERLYRGGRPPPDVAGRIVVLVDDGLATGATMYAAVATVRRGGARRIVVAVPVAAAETCAQLGGRADAIICLHTPKRFRAVGVWYRDFAPTEDEEVRALLDAAAERTRPGSRT